MRSRWTSVSALAVLAVVAAGGSWSCGGPYDSPTAPVAVQPESPAATVAAQTNGEPGGSGVTSSCHRHNVTICHKGQTLQVSMLALIAHLRHHDRLGACEPAVATCPCFTSTGLADVASQCDVAPIASCPEQYSINLFCAPGGGGGTVGNLGLFEARLGTGTCSTTSQDLMTGEAVTTTLAVTSAQYAACKQAIVASSYYPASCPR